MLERAERKGDTARAAALSEELKQPPFPLALNYLWRSFIRLRGRKGCGFSGAEPITWPEIDAYTRQTRTSFAPWEIELLEELDGLYLEVLARVKKSSEGAQS
ncbi:hypothetical protein APY04_0836 [Hyphomicrobium sulfonivorans]|uniref:Uncharacterized protein n=1 Tax=Hyphomicrobium sulfonivorans TaxID=121290 RepID=A0A109BLK5_HYPSL|nr:hypothetical protein [Hyphomicrobium sulfonivorans]KWT70775.1 hypothetical protein APY04_0836 [Hyphomicrobium sulfonivorans]